MGNFSPSADAVKAADILVNSPPLDFTLTRLDPLKVYEYLDGQSKYIDVSSILYVLDIFAAVPKIIISNYIENSL